MIITINLTKNPNHLVYFFQAQPVDLFPHTNHCELVVLFERASKQDTPVQKTDNVETFCDKEAQRDAITPNQMDAS